ncbi:hypothetical protein [Phenylobacterium sp.]|uniref:hypothetical protein n=1 Tax=Phenylobacterium sp. TaxID=1871053 RepID=UPI0035B15470
MTLTLARDLQVRALEAQTTEEAARLARAFQQVSRGLRQTLALELKVIRYKDEQAREAAAAEAEVEALQRRAAEARDQAVEKRRRAIRDRAHQAIWTEAEADEFPEDFEPPEDPERLARALEAWLDEAVRRDDFLTDDFDILVIEACDAIGADAGLLYDIEDRPWSPPDPASASAEPDPAPTPQPADSS